MRPSRLRLFFLVAAMLTMSAQQAWSYGHTGYRWPKSAFPIPVLINQNLHPNCPTAIDVISQAFKTWEAVPNAAIRYDMRGTTFAGKAKQDGVNLVTWSDMRQAIGLTTIWYKPNREVYECDMELNDGVNWACDGNPTAYDVLNVVTHEAGHFLVLDDLYSSEHREITMYGIVNAGETNKSDLHQDDITGAQHIYPNGPPLPPWELRVGPLAGASHINWDRTVSYNLDQANLYRRAEGEATKTLIAQTDSLKYQGLEYVDTAVTDGVTYYYSMTCSDDTDQEGASTAEYAVTPLSSRPLVGMGGYWDTVLVAGNSGEAQLKVWAVAVSPASRQLFVEVFASGVSTGVSLQQVSGTGAQVQGFSLEIPVNQTEVAPLSTLLELRAHDSEGSASLFWPYLIIEP